MNGFRIYSCYFSPNIEITEFLNKIDKLVQHVRSYDTPVLIGGDFNSKSSEWSSRTTDRRGVAVSEMIASLGLIVLNRGNTPTFQRGEANSIIDITLGSLSIARKICQWEVLTEETLSDHQYIMMTITQNTTPVNTAR